MTLLGVMAPVLFCVLCGVLWSRHGQPYDVDMVSRLVMTVGAPCLIVSTLAQVELDMSELMAMALAYGVVQALTMLLAMAWLHLFGLSARKFFNAMVFPNVGNMGLPLCLLAFGDRGLALALAWFMVNSILHFSVGIMVASGQWQWRLMISNPVVLAAGLSVALLSVRMPLPAWLVGALDLAGSLTIPMMLITLGVSLASLPWSGLVVAGQVALGRLAIGLAAGWWAIEWLDLSGLVASVVLVQSTMPVAVFNYLFAQRYGQGGAEVAASVMVSTLLSLLSVPLVLGWVLSG